MEYPIASAKWPNLTAALLGAVVHWNVIQFPGGLASHIVESAVVGALVGLAVWQAIAVLVDCLRGFTTLKWQLFGWLIVFVPLGLWYWSLPTDTEDLDLAESIFYRVAALALATWVFGFGLIGILLRVYFGRER
jgi:hypothetical protein